MYYSALEVPEAMRCMLLLCLPEVMHRVLLCMLETVEGVLCLLEGMRRMLLYILEAVEGGLRSLGVLDVLEVLEAMRRVLEAMEGKLYLPEVMHCVPLCLSDALEVSEVMRCVLLCMLEGVENGFVSIATVFSLQLATSGRDSVESMVHPRIASFSTQISTYSVSNEHVCIYMQ